MQTEKWIGTTKYTEMYAEKPAIIKWIRNKWLKKKSPIVLVVGHRRTGKTATALRLAYDLNHNFDINKDMHVDLEEFMLDIEKSDNSVKVLDEVGATLDPKEQFNKMQRVYAHVTQTQGYKNNVVILCLPFASEFGKEHRKHVNFLIKVFNRGCFESFYVMADPVDLSLKPPPILMIERVVGYPLPPDHIWNQYKAKVEKMHKDLILKRELERLQQMRIAKELKKQKKVYANINLFE